MKQNARTGKKSLYWFALIVLYIATRLPLLDVPLDRDEGAFGLIGQAILNGKLPYQDIFDHKPPGVFYIYALSLLLLPATASGVHLFLHIWNFGSLLLVHSVASTLFKGNTGLFAALIFLFLSGAPSVQGFSASTENFLILPMMGSIALVLASPGGSLNRRRILLISAGVLGATSCWIKPVAFFPLLIIPVILFGINGKVALKDALASFSWWFTGGLLLSCSVSLPFFLKGLGIEFYYWSFAHNMLYSAESWSGNIAKKMLQLQIPRLLPDMIMPGILALLGIFTAFIQMNKKALTAVLFLTLSTLGASFSGYFYNHYFSIMTPALSILAAFYVTSVAEKNIFLARKPILGVSIAVVFILSTVALRPWYWFNPEPEIVTRKVLGKNSFEAASLIAEYLKERVTPDQRIYIDGSEPQIAFLANRENASPFVMAYPLTKPWKRNREFQQRAWSSIESDKPEYIVVSWITTTRSDDKVDPFLENKLSSLVDATYTLDSLVLEKPQGSHVIRKGPFSPKKINELTPDIRFILWRKRYVPARS